MKKLIFLALLFSLSACSSNEAKLLDEKTAMPDQVQKNEVAEPNIPVPDLNNTPSNNSNEAATNNTNNDATNTNNESNNTNNNQSSMTNPRTTIGDGVELKDLATEYTGAIIKTNLGDIKVKFYGEESPLTVNNFLNLAQAGFYDGTRFHRIIKDFMIQAGDPNSKDTSKKQLWGTGGPEYRFRDEFNSNPLVSGSLAMANAGPETNGSQFFIVTKDSTPWLDGKHTNFGEVVEGMDVVKKIEASETDASDKPLADVLLNSVQLLK